MESAHKKTRPILIDGPIGATLIRLTIPMIFGMVGIIAFNLVDTFFVGQLGTRQLAALSFTFPVVMVIGSLALGLGTGASAIISRAIGEGDSFRVKRLTTDSLVLSILIVAAVIILGFLTMGPLFRLLGATPAMVPLIKEYMIIWYPGMIFLVVPMVGNNAIRATGDTKTPALIMLLAALLNTLVDPLLIFGLGPFPRLGLAGAAAATVFSRAITLLAAFWVLWYRDEMITFAVPTLKATIKSWASILYIGIPTAGTRMVVPLSIGVITRLMASYGPESVAGFGVATRVEFFAMTVLVALSSVIGPFVGQNWGAGRYERVRSGTRYAEWFSIAWGIAMLILLAATARSIAILFSDNHGVIVTASLYLMIVPVGFGCQGILQISAMTLNVLQRPLHAAALVAVRMFVLYVPLAFAGSYMFGLMGAFSGIALANVLGGIFAHFLLKRILDAEIAVSTRTAS